MALTISQIMSVAGQAGIDAIGRRYKMSPILNMHNVRGDFCYFTDPDTGLQVNIAWSYDDDIRQRTEAQKIDFTRALIRNGIDALDFAVRHQGGGNPYNDEVEETIFD